MKKIINLIFILLVTGIYSQSNTKKVVEKYPNGQTLAKGQAASLNYNEFDKRFSVNDKSEYLENGIWEFYYPNGQLWQKGEYIIGGVKIGGQSRIPKYEFFRIPYGNWKFYYPNGKIAMDVNYKKDPTIIVSGCKFLNKEYKGDYVVETESAILYWEFGDDNKATEYNGNTKTHLTYKIIKDENDKPINAALLEVYESPQYLTSVAGYIRKFYFAKIDEDEEIVSDEEITKRMESLNSIEGSKQYMFLIEKLKIQ